MNTKQIFPLLAGLFLAGISNAVEPTTPTASLPTLFKWADATRLERPFSKDPSVIRFGGRYLMYFSLPPFATNLAPANAPRGWSIG
ncbi:MAG: hypothetical protein WCJ07_14480, partial [Verrucomicrobiota bacterium]